MTAKDAVLERIRAQQHDDNGGHVHRSLLVREEWLRAIDELFGRFRGWLTEAETVGLRVVEDKDHVNEDRLGTYSVPTLQLIFPSGDSILIKPKARYVVGGSGRVDFERVPRSMILVRKQAEPPLWQFARLVPSYGRWTFEDLSEDSFWKVIDELFA